MFKTLSKFALCAGVFGVFVMSAPQAQATGFLTKAVKSTYSGYVLAGANQDDVRQQGAQEFIGAMAGDAIGFLSDEDLSDKDKEKAFAKLLRRNFDIPKIARFALGQYYRGASKTQIKDYNNLFEDMIIETYSARFNEYSGQEIEVKNARPEGKKDIMVRSAIVSSEGPDVDVDWRVRYSSGRYRVIDVIVEGVSMALTQRSEFASVIQRGGGDVDVLIAHLDQ